MSFTVASLALVLAAWSGCSGVVLAPEFFDGDRHDDEKSETDNQREQTAVVPLAVRVAYVGALTVPGTLPAGFATSTAEGGVGSEGSVLELQFQEGELCRTFTSATCLLAVCTWMCPYSYVSRREFN